MEKLCIDVRGFSEEKKKRVQDAFFKLGYKWNPGGSVHRWINSDDVACSGNESGNIIRSRPAMSFEPNITYPDLMRKAGMDESDPATI